MATKSTDTKEKNEQETSRPVEIKSYWWPEQSNINLREVESGYFTLVKNFRPFLVLIPFLFFLGYVIAQTSFFVALLELLTEWLNWLYSQRESKYYEMLLFSLFLSFFLWWFSRQRAVYLVDFVVWDGEPSWKLSNDDFVKLSYRSKTFTQDSLDFQEKIARRTGLGDSTYLPPWLVENQSKLTMENAREEARQILFSIFAELLKRTGLKPHDIDILIVNCSLFCPTPSLSSLIVNHFKLKSDILSYNLGGMGCSAGIISIDLAKHLLQSHKNCRTVVISTENITLNWYRGNEKGMLLQNALFRCGGAAILLSNRYSDGWRSKYQLFTTVRTHKGSSDAAYESVYQEEDETGLSGIRLSRDLMNVVGEALRSNMSTLGPLVLPWSEQLKFVLNLIQAKITKQMNGKKIPPYVPNFKKAFQHFCIHAGGRAIIDGLEENLKLEARHVEPSRATLYRYGNTSSSSVWYEMAYSERMGYIQKGDRIWQIALGSGFKCNSAVWVSLKSFKKIQVENATEDKKTN